MAECAPVLFLVFNRPKLAEQVFDRIRAAQPAKLFIASDGPRASRAGEADLVQQCRQLAQRVDWSCEVQTLFREKNLGCREAVASAITWFFSQVEEGIILEDDCLPHRDFFKFCTQMLEHYRSDRRVMSVTGCNFQNGQRRGSASYYFSVYSHIWGWACWRRAWQLYDMYLQHWPRLRDEKLLDGFLRPAVAKHWASGFDSVANGTLDTWDYAWVLSCWANNGLCVIPNVNLISNIGFGADATHTTNMGSQLSGISTDELHFPLKHPEIVCRNVVADRYTDDAIFVAPKAPLPYRVIKRIQRAFTR